MTRTTLTLASCLSTIVFAAAAAGCSVSDSKKDDDPTPTATPDTTPDVTPDPTAMIADRDRDGVADAADNCPDVPNPSQGPACEGTRELESNDGIEEAQQIESGTPIHGDIAGVNLVTGQDDVDVFSFSALGGTLWRVTVKVEGLDSKLQPAIIVDDGSGRMLRRASAGEGVDAVREVVINDDGEYFIVVWDRRNANPLEQGGDDPPPSQGLGGKDHNYVVEVSQFRPETTDVELPYTGEVEVAPGRLQVFAFDADENDTVHIETRAQRHEPASDLDTLIWTMNPEGFLVSAHDDISRGRELDSLIRQNINATGEWWAVIDHWGADPEDAREISVNIAALVPGVAMEPDGSAELALPLVPDVEVAAAVDEPQTFRTRRGTFTVPDEDWLRVIAPEGSLLSVRAWPEEDADADPQLLVVVGSGFSASVLTRNDQSDGGPGARVDFVMPGRDTFIIVRDARNFSGGEDLVGGTGNEGYRLIMEVLEPQTEAVALPLDTEAELPVAGSLSWHEIAVPDAGDAARLVVEVWPLDARATPTLLAARRGEGGVLTPIDRAVAGGRGERATLPLPELAAGDLLIAVGDADQVGFGGSGARYRLTAQLESSNTVTLPADAEDIVPVEGSTVITTRLELDGAQTKRVRVEYGAGMSLSVRVRPLDPGVNTYLTLTGRTGTGEDAEAQVLSFEDDVYDGVLRGSAISDWSVGRYRVFDIEVGMMQDGQGNVISADGDVVIDIRREGCPDILGFARPESGQLALSEVWPTAQEDTPAHIEIVASSDEAPLHLGGMRLVRAPAEEGDEPETLGQLSCNTRLLPGEGLLIVGDDAAGSERADFEFTQFRAMEGPLGLVEGQTLSLQTLGGDEVLPITVGAPADSPTPGTDSEGESLGPVERGNNSSRNRASPLHTNNGWTLAALPRSDDVDYFSIELQRGDRLTLQTAGIEDSRGNQLDDPILTLLDPDGQTYAQADDRNVFAGDLQAELTRAVIPEDGTYTIRVQAGSGQLFDGTQLSTRGGYGLRVEVAPR